MAVPEHRRALVVFDVCEKLRELHGVALARGHELLPRLEFPRETRRTDRGLRVDAPALKGVQH
eukprot:2627819-Pyramimonas_sp.AAC.1